MSNNFITPNNRFQFRIVEKSLRIVQSLPFAFFLLFIFSIVERFKGCFDMKSESSCWDELKKTDLSIKQHPRGQYLKDRFQQL
jgi:hypothetical protein